MNPFVHLRQTKHSILRFARFIRCELIGSLGYFLYPPFCFVCDSDLQEGESLVCERCWSHLELIDHPFCLKCGTPLTVRDTPCGFCKGKEFSFEATRAAYRYTEDIRKMIHAFKFQRKTSLAKRFGRIVALTTIRNRRFKEVDYVLPVPLHTSRLRERGYNQSGLLAEEISAELGVKYLPDILVRKKRTKAMTALTPQGRQKNSGGDGLIV